jgi:hypothetical protein
MCCGQQRKQYRSANSVTRVALLLKNTADRSRLSTVKFEYFGRTALTVLGVTGKSYHFERPGFQVEVDLRDVNSLASVPNLRQAAAGR